VSDDNTPTVRLNRFLAQSGVASRRGADTLIAEGRVRVDGVVAKPGTQVGPNAVVTVNGVAVEEERHVYLMMNKPEGFVTTLSDEKGRPTVMELVDVTERVVPVGRGVLVVLARRQSQRQQQESVHVSSSLTRWASR
jgi:23S rRNA pseudouridine2605 synthase